MKKNKKDIPVIIDYLSFTFCPTELKRLFELCKANTEFVSVARSSSGDPYTIKERARTNPKRFISQALKGLDIKISDNARSVNDVKKDLFDNHIGLNVLDSLCVGAIERFVDVMNNPALGMSQEDNHWSIKLRSGGYSGYAHSANLLINGMQAGLLAWGAKNGGCYVSVSGTGCAAIHMDRFKMHLQGIDGVKITRIDLAGDSLDGFFDVDYARQMAEDGQFVTQGRCPSYTYIESGHMAKAASYEKVSGNEESFQKRYGFVASKGRSFYVGSRESGKLLRVYEKGKQLQSEEHYDWVRWEVEFRSKGRVIPLDTLTNPTAFLTGAYPALDFVSNEGCSIATTKRIYNIGLERAVKAAATQCGNTVAFLHQVMDLSADSIVNLLSKHVSLDENLPDKFNIINYRDSQTSMQIALGSRILSI